MQTTLIALQFAWKSATIPFNLIKTDILLKLIMYIVYFVTGQINSLEFLFIFIYHNYVYKPVLN